MKSKILFLFALSICLGQFAFGQVPMVGAEKVPGGYLIGPGDVVRISIPTEPQFEVQQATVDEDGKIQIPFSDEGIMVRCKTEKQLKAEVTQIYSKYLKNPQVSANVVQRNSRPPAIIFGEIRTPQKIDLTRKARLLDLISLSGGVTEEAGGMVQVYHMQPPICKEDVGPDYDWTEEANVDSEYLPSRMYSYSSLSKGTAKSNPIIYPGDLIVVHKALPIYVMGEVRSAQGVFIKENGLTLSEALAKVGGISPTAKKKDIKIYRLKPNSKERETISANYSLILKREQADPVLEPYDIIEVEKAPKSAWQIALEVVTGAGRTALTTVSSAIPQRVVY